MKLKVLNKENKSWKNWEIWIQPSLIQMNGKSKWKLTTENWKKLCKIAKNNLSKTFLIKSVKQISMTQADTSPEPSRWQFKSMRIIVKKAIPLCKSINRVNLFRIRCVTICSTCPSSTFHGLICKNKFSLRTK